jgi:flavin-dependent thymidylate synthase
MGEEIQKWADDAMFAAEPMDVGEGEQIMPRVYLLQATPDPLGGIAAMAMMYEGKVVRNLHDITDEQRRHYWEESQKTHLRAPHEAVDLHFMVEGVTRAFTHQMVRQRTAVYAQESLRFAVKEGFADEVPLPPSLMGLKPDDASVRAWQDCIKEVEEMYEFLINRGVPAEDARGLLPHSITTRLNYKTNLRNLVEHIGNRLCTQAQFEWRLEVTELMRAIRMYKGPITAYGFDSNLGPDHERGNAWQFKTIAKSELFRPVCYSLGYCPFTADFDRGCTIRGRVEEGKFNEIDIREWLMDPAAARRG